MNLQILNILALNEYTLIQQLYNNITTKNTKAETLENIINLINTDTIYKNTIKNIDSVDNDNLIYLHSRIITAHIEENITTCYKEEVYTQLSWYYIIDNKQLYKNNDLTLEEEYTEVKNTNSYIENLVNITDKIFFQYIKPNQNYRNETIDLYINRLYENQTEDTIYTDKSIVLYKRLFKEFNTHFIKHLYKMIDINI